MMKIGKSGAIFLLLNFYLYIAAASICAYAGEADVPDSLPRISAEAAFESKYIWRGQTLSDDFVVQPQMSVGLGGFTFSVWGSYDTGSAAGFNERDYILDYTFNAGDIRKKPGVDEDGSFRDLLNISLGYTYYTFPNLSGDEADSHEFYTGVAFDTFLQPFLTYYYDFDTGGGSYCEFGAGHTFEFPGNVTAELAATTGYNIGQWGYGSSFSSLLFSGQVSLPVCKYFVMSPNVNYSLALDDEYDCEFYAGAAISLGY